MDFPVLIGSLLCSSRSDYAHPSVYHLPYTRLPVNLVNRNFKICPHEEYTINNRVLGYSPSKVEIRCKFFQANKRFRTNCTLKFAIEPHKLRGIPNWELTPRFIMELPHETPRSTVSVMALSRAYEWEPEEFIAAVTHFLGGLTHASIDRLLSSLRSDGKLFTGTAHAQYTVAQGLAKCRAMTSEEDMLRYVKYNLYSEILPHLVPSSNHTMTADTDTDRHINVLKGLAIAQAVAELILLDPSVQAHVPHAQRMVVYDRLSYVFKRIDTPGEKMAALVRKFLRSGVRKSFLKLRMQVDSQTAIDLTFIVHKTLFKPGLTAAVRNGVWDAKSDTTENNQNKTQMMITGFCADSNHVQTQKILRYAMKKTTTPRPC